MSIIRPMASCTDRLSSGISKKGRSRKVYSIPFVPSQHDFLPHTHRHLYLAIPPRMLLLTTLESLTQLKHADWHFGTSINPQCKMFRRSYSLHYMILVGRKDRRPGCSPEWLSVCRVLSD